MSEVHGRALIKPTPMSGYPRGTGLYQAIAPHMQPHALAEVPYTFQQRVFSQSRLSTKIVIAFVHQLGSLFLHNSVRWHRSKLANREGKLPGIPV